jgi:pseudouridine-5'-phosphate glycosidase/sugar/nucleoside kinase (ribokinase family)
MWQRLARKGFVAQQRRRMYSSLLVEPRVQEAIANGEPVVALESTIVAHGMPYPQNLQVAQEVESILRREGVTPATIAVCDGVCRVGLTLEELQDLAKAGPEGRAQKCSTRDLSLIMATHDKHHPKQPHEWGATTVASTMTLAEKAGITTFVTGGIGGVHRNGHVTMDVSADLTELSRTPVVVVSAGIKSILDIGRTLEYLETMGVPTVSYQTDEFPAFFSPHSGVDSPARMDDADSIAKAYWVARELGLSHGMLVAVPNNDSAGENVERAIQQALMDAEAQGIHGQATTPFVLKQVALLTGGDSLRSNMALVRNNARVGAEIAKSIAAQRNRSTRRIAPAPAGFLPKNPQQEQSRIVVLGGAVVDILARPDEELLPATSNPGVCTESDGGVGRNIAEVLGRLGSRPLMYSAVGNDSRGRALKSQLQDECNVIDRIEVVDNLNTATYLAVMDGSNDLHTAIADMKVLSQIHSPPVEVLQKAEILVMDANPPVSVMKEAALAAVDYGVKVYIDTTSVYKARAIAANKDLLSSISFIFPNMDELVAMAEVVIGSVDDVHPTTLLVDKLETIRTLAPILLHEMHPVEAHAVITMGQDGVLLASRVNDNISFHHFASNEDIQVLNATGAGDSLCGAFAHGILEGRTVADSVSFGMEAARLSLQCSDRAVSPKLSILIR